MPSNSGDLITKLIIIAAIYRPANELIDSYNEVISELLSYSHSVNLAQPCTLIFQLNTINDNITEAFNQISRMSHVIEYLCIISSILCSQTFPKLIRL